ncbi:MAG: hypothetical protein M0Q42_03635 [Xanthomonadales bacterium]|nr:hypothetical protein [Xanthomonadales bacterium]
MPRTAGRLDPVTVGEHLRVPGEQAHRFPSGLGNQQAINWIGMQQRQPLNANGVFRLDFKQLESGLLEMTGRHERNGPHRAGRFAGWRPRG